MKNRATEEIIKGMEKGENFFILHGKYIHDMFLYDFYTGVCNLKDIYAKHFLEEAGFDCFMYCKNSEFAAYKLTDNGITDCTSSMFRGKATGALAGALDGETDTDNSGNTDAREAAAAAAENANSHSEDYNFFQKSVKYTSQHTNERIAFFFEDFEWTIGAYRSSNDDQLMYIEKLLDLGRLKNTVSLISISNPEILKRYNIDTSGKNVIMLGSPAKDEIFRSYLRIYIRKYQKGNIDIDIFTELYSISEEIASGEKSLNSSIKVFDNVMEKTDGSVDRKDFSQSLDKIIEEKVTLDDVIISEKTKNDVVNQIDEFLAGGQVAKGFILTGPPGTGKTYLVKALANEKNCFFLSPSLAELKGEYIGHSSAKVKRMFDTARANAPTILFIDEADTVFAKRDASIDSDSFTHDMVNQFLVEMDGLTSANSKVFVIAATNRVEMLDNAIKSRLASNPIEIPLPDYKNREKLFDKMLIEMGMTNFKSFRFAPEFLEKTERMSGRDIKTFVKTTLDGIIKRERERKPLDSYTDERETEELFYRALAEFEKNKVRELQAELGIDIISCDKNNLRFNDIIGCGGVKSAVNRQIDMFDPFKSKNAKNYFKPRRGILLYGPPGNGKSQLAQAAAGEHGLYFIRVTKSVLGIGDPAQSLVSIFNGAMQLSKINPKGVVLFFDEFDEFVTLLLRGTLLTQLDDENTMRNPETRVLFIAATNFYDRLDSAVIRDGRIDDKIRVDDPTDAEGVQMIKRFIEAKKGNVIVPEDDICSEIYRLCTAYFIQNRQRKPLEENTEDESAVRPSGSAIKTFVERLIEEAYYQMPRGNNETKLKINMETVRDLRSLLGVSVQI